MKNNEKKLILDLYKHYKSVTEITVDEVSLLYSKHGNIRNILRNLIQEFEPNSEITEEYLDEKLKNYSIYEEEDTVIKVDDQKDSSIKFNSKDKSSNKSFKKILFIVIGILLIITIIWLLLDRQKIKNEVQQNIEINDKPSIEDEAVVNTSLQNSKYGNESYEEENEENSTNIDKTSEINLSKSPSQGSNEEDYAARYDIGPLQKCKAKFVGYEVGDLEHYIFDDKEGNSYGFSAIPSKYKLVVESKESDYGVSPNKKYLNKTFAITWKSFTPKYNNEMEYPFTGVISIELLD